MTHRPSGKTFARGSASLEMTRPAALTAFLVLAASIAAAAPPNDACENALAVPDERANRFFDSADLATATTAPDEPTGCGVFGVVNTVWYRWTAPADGELLVLSSCFPPTYPIVANVWDGTCTALGSLADCGDGACNEGQLARAAVTADASYLVQVGLESGAGATSALGVQLCFLGPEQDDADNDLLPDCLDSCTDSDFDGFGDGPLELRPFDTCPADNCPEVSNPDQGDRDGDGVGDACDDDEDKDEKTLQEAADMDLVELSSKGCFDGDCVAITIRAPADRGVLVRIRSGDVLVNRDESEQELGVTRPRTVYVPAGRTVRLEGLFTVCLELDKHAPSSERIFDVTENLDTARPEQANLVALRALLQLPPSDRFQLAVWALTNDVSVEDEITAAILRAAGLDPAALPSGGFPTLLNPNEGSVEPRARYLRGLLLNAPAECTGQGSALDAARCLLDRLTTLVDRLPAESVKAKVRSRLGKRVRAIRTKVDAAAGAGGNAARAAKLRRKARSRVDRLVGLLTRYAAKGKLPETASAPLIDTAAQLGETLGR